MTRGERLVGADFNPSGSAEIAAVKRIAASLIDAIDRVDGGGDGAVERSKSLAVTHVETAVMFGVKASAQAILAKRR